MDLENLRSRTERSPQDLDVRVAYLEQLARKETAEEVWGVIQNLEGKDQSEHVDEPSLETYEKLRAKAKLRLDYNEDQIALVEANLAERRVEQLKNENGVVVGERIIHDYQSDYLENGERYEMPSWEEVVSLLNEEHFKLYAEMKKMGLEPKLRCKPIDYKIKSLASRIDVHKTMPNQRDTHVWSGLDESELRYEPESYDASDPDLLVTNGGKSKEEWIKENRGWIIEIVATKQELDPHPDIPYQEYEEFTNAQKIEIYHRILKNRGFNGPTYETSAIDQIYVLEEGKPLEKENWTILPDSSLANRKSRVSCAAWSIVRVYLGYDRVNDRSSDLRCRQSVRVKRKS